MRTLLLLFAALQLALLGSVVYAFVTLSGQERQIQQSRQSMCLDSNRRHDATIGALDKVIANAGRTATAAQAQRLRASAAATTSLIDTLAPKRDCSDLASP